MDLVSCANTHHDVTNLVNHWMVKNTKTWISWEWNITFLWNKKIVNLCLKWHILRSYRFVVEVTFKALGIHTEMTKKKKFSASPNGKFFLQPLVWKQKYYFFWFEWNFWKTFACGVHFKISSSLSSKPDRSSHLGRLIWCPLLAIVRFIETWIQ